ncbi:FISUMP domain-containing protein [Odoribacter lunatus]|uniref:FISUMP domain-containing protein n=1 Tax=Odoribacter lunatus TaxID=2941335 RepID=UPI00203D248E|nr:FISUMP domain-containing protein [Odoribacter lunatus]
MYDEKVKGNRRYNYCKTLFVVLVTYFCMSSGAYANNVRLNGTVKVTDVSGGVATLELDLTWENSWRDNFNWDAVWLFLKTKPASGAWSHVMLQDVTHSATNGYVVMNGKNSSGNVVGVYVFPGANGTTKNVSTKVTLKWACGGAYTKTTFDNNQAFILAQGIEMVYVPFGAYYLGDGASTDALCAADGKPLAVNGEGAITTISKRAADGSVSAAVNNLPANYPKGYGGFYVMKYETSQEQYVTFLNTLTRAEQETLLGASRLAALSTGRYVFGDSLRPSFRNGIILSGKVAGQPYIFDNNLNGNTKYGEDGDGQCIACNYMSLNDVLAYASWAGLRPMSEMEYERACRAPFPQEPLAKEYVWNSNGGMTKVTSISAGGRETEVAGNSSANVNSGNVLPVNDRGPVRCGLFARSTSTQVAAGATYWGVMEMAGNVRELVASVSHTSLSRTTNGEGAFNTALWTSTPTLYGHRGGSFAGADNLLYTSDRSEMTAVASVAERDSTVGFRLTRTLDAGSASVNPGTIALSAPLCPDVESTVSETAAASVTGVSGTFPLTYTWSYSVNNGATWTVITGATGNTLKYSAFEAGKTYLFRRTAVCALGEAYTQTTGIAVTAPTIINSVSSTTDNTCKTTFTISASGVSLSYQWEKDSNPISGATATTYKTGEDGTYRCVVTGTCGSKTSDEQIINTQLPGDGILIDGRDNKRYRTRVLADGHEWMIEDLKFGNCSSSSFAAYYQKSVQNQIAPNVWGVCIASTVEGAGYLYNWQAAMNDANAVYNTAGNPSGNVNGNSPVQWQGICPDGWHLPSGGSTGEFQQLYTALGSAVNRIYPGCDDFRGVLGGRGNHGGTVNVNGYGHYWSGTWISATHAYSMTFNSGAVYPQNNTNKYWGFAVRCVKNY